MIKGFPSIKTIDDVRIKNKRIIFKADFNFTIAPDGSISNDRKMVKQLPTIRYLLKHKNRLRIITHLGMLTRNDKPQSTQVIADHLQTFFPRYKVRLIKDFLSRAGVENVESQGDDEILLFDNIRLFPEEKKNDPEFGRKIAALGDVYVVDGFPAIHRAHASVVQIAPHTPSFAGFLVKHEVEMLSKVIRNPKKPLVSIISGKKISTKVPVIKRLLDISDHVLVGGGIANAFFRARGLEIGNSLVEETAINDAKRILESASKKGKNLILPKDVVVAKNPEDSKGATVKSSDAVSANEMILDMGPDTTKEFTEAILHAKTIIWNGPMGLFEKPTFRAGTDAIYDAIVANTETISIIGGTDTYIAISKKPNLDKITHISTGGGAMLAFIERGTLPGLEVLRKETN